MKNSASLFAITLATVALIGAGPWTSSARAQGAPSAILPGGNPPPMPNGNAGPMPNTEYGRHHKDVEKFGDFLDSNPSIAQDLNKNPRLIRNPQYVDSHPELKSYLQSHPDVARRYEKHPVAFMHREHRYDKSAARYERKHHEN